MTWSIWLKTKYSARMTTKRMVNHLTRCIGFSGEINNSPQTGPVAAFCFNKTSAGLLPGDDSLRV